MLRDYQTRADVEIESRWQTYRRNMLQLPTGGGKTIITTNVTRRRIGEGQRVLFLAHREELISQAWHTFAKHQIHAGIIKADVRPNFSLPAQIGSIQTVVRRKRLPPADVVIIDEGHHALDDNSYGAVIKEHFPHAFVLAVTATPYRLNGRGFKGLFDSLIETVQNADLINEGWLCPTRYFVCFNPDLSEIHTTAGDYNIEEAAFAVRNAPVVQSYMDHAEGKSGIVFAVNVAHSRQIVEDYRKAGISAAHIDANTPDEMRRRIIKDFKDKKTLIMSNVGIATEGFDVPNMDFVQLCAPSKSLSRFLQMCGRGGRVDNEIIKGMLSAEERKLAISLSAKPHCIILDNAGLYKEHGLPDATHNWLNHFNGYYAKRKKKIPDGEIEIEYIVEDESGRRMRMSTPEEVEGLKLIEIKKTIKANGIDMAEVLREYDDSMRLAFSLRKDEEVTNADGTKSIEKVSRVKKKGHFVFTKIMELCKRKGYIVTDEVWDMLIAKLYTEPEEKRLAELRLYNACVEALRLQFEGKTLTKAEKVATEFIDKKLDGINAVLLSDAYINKAKKDYIETLTEQTIT